MGLDYIDRIKSLKSEKKMTNEDLARASGIPLGTLSKLLTGVSDSVKLSNIVAICDALGCSVDYVVSGVPENKNNFTLDGAEIRMIEDYRSLDSFGRELVSVVISKERERVTHNEYARPSAPTQRRFVPEALIASPARRYADSDANRRDKRTIKLYDLPVSAGPGEYLDDDSAENITISISEATESVDYALRISGNSMEPRFHDGDILWVQNADSVEIGELGIFILDGNGYFKAFDGDSLRSLNPEYGKIMLKDFNDVVCVGRVLGKSKSKRR